MKEQVPRNEIVIVGELNVDLIANGLKSEPVLGHEILASDFEITLGSASAIFASGVAALGRSVTFVSCVGNDDFGSHCIQTLEEKGISTAHIKRTTSSRTGVTVVLSTPGERAMVTYLGTTSEMAYEDVPLDLLVGHRHMHLSSYFLQTNLRPDFGRLIREAKNRGLTVSFDPNSDPSGEWEKAIFEAIEATDILFLNKSEALQLTEMNDVESAVRELGKHCPVAVVKLGPEGAIGIQNGEILRVAGFEIEAVDTTGAGDSFDAGYIHAFLDGMSFRDCLLIGNACGAMSTARAGGTAAQPNINDVRDFLTMKGARARTV